MSFITARSKILPERGYDVELNRWSDAPSMWKSTKGQVHTTHSQLSSPCPLRESFPAQHYGEVIQLLMCPGDHENPTAVNLFSFRLLGQGIQHQFHAVVSLRFQCLIGAKCGPRSILTTNRELLGSPRAEFVFRKDILYQTSSRAAIFCHRAAHPPCWYAEGRSKRRRKDECRCCLDGSCQSNSAYSFHVSGREDRLLGMGFLPLDNERKWLSALSKMIMHTWVIRRSVSDASSDDRMIE